MPLIKNGRIAADTFTLVGLEDDLPEGDVIVPAERYFADPDGYAAREARLGIIWPNNRGIEELAPHLDRLDVVALVFPKYRDGRAYSQARILRERYRYAGELRATGEVLRDQFVFLMRSGFDALEVKKEADAEAYADVVRRYSVFYQPAADGRPGVLRARVAAPMEGASAKSSEHVS